MSGIGALAQVTTTSADTSVNGGLLLAWLVASYLLTVLPLWFIFKKAGQPEWAALIPIFNIYVMLKVVGRPGWWLLLFLIPFVGLIIWIIVAYDLARSFGHGAGFTIGLILLRLDLPDDLGLRGLQVPRAGGLAAAGCARLSRGDRTAESPGRDPRGRREVGTFSPAKTWPGGPALGCRQPLACPWRSP